MMPARLLLRRFAPLLLLLAVGACGDFFFDPDAPGTSDEGAAIVAVGASFSPAAAAAMPELGEIFDQTNRVEVRVTSVADGGLLHEGTHAVTPDEEGIRLELPIPLPGPSLLVLLELRLLDGTSLLFEGEMQLELVRGEPATAAITISPIPHEILIEGPALIDRIGESADFTATVVFENGDPFPGIELLWNSLDPAIVEIAPDGRAVSRAEGEARLEVRGGGLSATRTVRVEIGAAFLTVSPESLTLLAGATTTVSATVWDAEENPLDRPVTWRSSDSGIVSVTQNGMVQALAPGDAILTAESGALSAEIPVQVRETAPPSVSTDPATGILARTAVLHGRVGSETATSGAAWFELSGTPSFDEARRTGEVPVSGSGEARIEASLSDLEPETLYHYRLVFREEGGDALFGETATFTTLREVTVEVPQAVRRVDVFTVMEGSNFDRRFGLYHISWTGIPEGTEYIELLRQIRPWESDDMSIDTTVHRLSATATFFRDSEHRTEGQGSFVLEQGGDTIRIEWMNYQVWYGVRACNEAGCSDFVTVHGPENPFNGWITYECYSGYCPSVGIGTGGNTPPFPAAPIAPDR